jgi:hypothetical protein
MRLRGAYGETVGPAEDDLGCLSFWLLGVGLELGAAFGLFILIKKRGWF